MFVGLIPGLQPDGGGITDVEGAGERQPSHHHADAQLTFHRKHLSTFNFLMWLFLS